MTNIEELQIQSETYYQEVPVFSLSTFYIVFPKTASVKVMYIFPPNNFFFFLMLKIISKILK